MTDLVEIAWIAGLLEGEGCFMSRPGLTIQLTMTDKDIIDRAARLMGNSTKVYERPPNDTRKRAYTIRINGYRAVAWMLTIYSFMGERRKKKIRDNLVQWKKMKRGPRAMNGEPRLKIYATCHPNRVQYAGTLCEQCAKSNYHIRYKRKHHQAMSDYNIRYKRKHRQAIRRCAGTVDLFQ